MVCMYACVCVCVQLARLGGKYPVSFARRCAAMRCDAMGCDGIARWLTIQVTHTHTSIHLYAGAVLAGDGAAVARVLECVAQGANVDHQVN